MACRTHCADIGDWGGTGGLTTYVLPQLPAQWTKYVFTDVSKQFTTHAEQKFRDYPFVEYQLLNIEENPAAQGLALHSFDLVLASDVLHATRDLRQTIEHVKKLLASEGLLVLLEGTRTPPWGILTFGLLKGWWLFADKDLRRSDPWISRQAWQDLLTEVGFSEVAGVADTEEDTGSLHTVFLARGPQIQRNETAPNLGQAGVGRDEKSLIADPLRAEGDSEKPGSWLIFANSSGVAQQLAELLRARGETPILILPGVAFRQLRQDRFQIRPEQPEDMYQLLEAVRADQFSCRGVIHLWSLDIAPPEETTLADLGAAQTFNCISVLHLVQALAKVDRSDHPVRSPRLWLVTRNAQAAGEVVEPVSVAQAPLWGLGRVISNEYPQLHCTLVDLNSSYSHEEIDSLFAELWSNSEENEIVLRGEARYVPRLKQTSLANPFNLQLPITKSKSPPPAFWTT